MIKPGPQIPIIRTKLYLPRSAAGHITRQRLLDLMDRSLQSPLTLICAPAGYGKSALVADWARDQATRTAWVSLDDTESKLLAFASYFVAAIESVEPSLTPLTLELLSTPEIPSPKQLAYSLISDLDEFGQPLVIILDDYHVIDHTSEVHEFISALLKHPLENLHIILVGRHDPPLSIARMRASGQLTEIRVDELRFTAQETAGMVEAATARPIAEELLKKLWRDVEGWAAGLQMVLLAMGSADDPEQYLKTLEGNIPHIQDYLITEVLEGLSQEVRDYLLYAAIPEKFCAGLVTALLGAQEDVHTPESPNEEQVRFAYESNLFTYSMDETGTWYRYHHLFRELLLRQVDARFSAEQIAKLHIRASEWLHANGHTSDAIRQLLITGDDAAAAQLLEGHVAAELDNDRWVAVHEWLQLLPAEAVLEHPALLLANAWAAIYCFDREKFDELIPHLNSCAEAGILSAPQQAELDYFRGTIAFFSGEIEESRALFERALPAITEPGMIMGEFTSYLCLSRFMSGDKALALNELSRAEAQAVHNKESYTSRLAAARCYLGYLSLDGHAAMRAANKLVTIAAGWGSTYALAWGHYMRGLIQLNTLRLEDAAWSWERAIEGVDYVERRAAVDMLMAQALTFQLSGDPESARMAAQGLLEHAEEMQDIEHKELACSGAARVFLLQGDFDKARELCQTLAARPKATNMLFWLGEPWVTLARLRIRSGGKQELVNALSGLAEMRSQLEQHHLSCQLVDNLALQAIARHKLGEEASAKELLLEAIRLATPAAWSRPFIEIGAELVPLLEALQCDDSEGFFVQTLLTKLGGQPPGTSSAQEKPARAAGSAGSDSPGTADGLTNRELDVLELLAQRYRNKEIATKLFISTHTVNYHLKHIYQKMGVSGRRQAVSKALEEGLLSG